eukprot:4658494-Prymnesium_polylepis.1
MHDLLAAAKAKRADLALLTRLAHARNPALMDRLEAAGIRSALRHEALRAELVALPLPGVELAPGGTASEPPASAQSATARGQEAAGAAGAAGETYALPAGGRTGQDLYTAALRWAEREACADVAPRKRASHVEERARGDGAVRG